MHEFWYGYVKPKYGEKANLCYMDTDSFVVYVKTEDIYKILQRNLKRFDTSNIELDRPLPKRTSKFDQTLDDIRIEKIILAPI